MPLKRACETISNGASIVGTWNLKKWCGALFVICFLVVFPIFSLFAFGLELFEPFGMQLGSVAPPTLAFGVATPMLFLASERNVAFVCFPTFWRVAVDGIAILVMRGLFLVFVLILALGLLFFIPFVLAGTQKDTTLFLGGIPLSFLLQSSFHILSFLENCTDSFQQGMFH